MIPITYCNPGDRVRIKKITGTDKVRQHLAELGCVLDAEVSVVSKVGENMILQVAESRVAIDKTLTNRIFV